MRLAGRGFLVVTSSITLTHIFAADSEAALKQKGFIADYN